GGLRRARRGCGPPGALPRDPRPLLRPRRELPRDRRGARAAGRHDREPHLPLPRKTPQRLRRKKRARNSVQRTGDVMSAYDIERLSRLIGMLPPAPAAWVRAARELPRARRELDGIVERAEADAEYRRALIADLESALRAEGVEPTWPLLDELRRRVS